MKHYYDTTGLTGTGLLLAEQKAEKQDEIILEIFKQSSRYPFTPFEIDRALRDRGHVYPITSIRRAITTLTKSGKLVKSERAEAKGIYHVNNHRWQYNSAQEAAA